MSPASVTPFRLSRWWAVPAAALLVVGLWWTRPAPAGNVAADAGGADGPASVGALPSVTISLAPAVSSAGVLPEPTVATVPPGTAQVTLRLAGELPPAADLTAEITAVERDEFKRWPVDDATPGMDGATRAVTVPPYAVPAGRFVLTLWAGDADVVARYRFRVATP